MQSTVDKANWGMSKNHWLPAVIIFASLILCGCGESFDSRGQIAFSNNSDGDWEIFLLDLDSGIARQLTNNSTLDWRATWSPDGTQIAFASMYLQGEIRETFEADENGDFQRVVREITGPQDIVTTPSDGFSLTHLTQEAAVANEPAWSPDGQKLAYESDVTGDVEIFTMNVDGTSRIPLTDGVGEDWHPDWSPDGSMIVFTSSRTGNWDLFTINVSNGELFQLTDTPEDEWRPTWSPDGQRIAFSKAARQDSNWDVFTMDPEGNDVVQVTDDPGTDFEPVWSPDGKQLAFASSRSGSREIYIMDADGGSVEPLGMGGIPSDWTTSASRAN